MGAGARVSVERVDARLGRCGRSSGDAAVGAGARVPVGCGDVFFAAAGGHLEVLQLARERGPGRKPGASLYPRERLSLSLSQWARVHHCPWNKWTCYFAAQNERLEVLQWARAHGCPWSKRECVNASWRHPEKLAWVRAQPDE